MPKPLGSAVTNIWFYHNLLADKVPMSSDNEADLEDTGGASLGTDDEDSEDSEDGSDLEERERGTPRGKRHQYKDAEKVSILFPFPRTWDHGNANEKTGA